MPTKIAVVQFDVHIADRQFNLAEVEAKTYEAAANRAQLVLFPEAAITGYCYRDLDEALHGAEATRPESVERLTVVCRRTGVFVVYGTLERVDDRLYNVGFVVGPQGLVGRYEKVHLPFLGVDRFTTAGNTAPNVYELAGIRVGTIVCYDLTFPEITRSLALDGADLVVQVTNSPSPGDFARQVLVPARAFENGIYLARANRIGTERGVTFPGLSQVCDPIGKTIAEAAHADPAIVYAEIDPDVARDKRRIVTPGEFETEIFEDRRPDIYGRLIEPKRSRPTPERSDD